MKLEHRLPKGDIRGIVPKGNMAYAKIAMLTFGIEPGLKVDVGTTARNEHPFITNMIAVAVCDYGARTVGEVQEQQALPLAKKRRAGAKTRKEAIAHRTRDLHIGAPKSPRRVRSGQRVHRKIK
jgi:hypothetical protein